MKIKEILERNKNAIITSYEEGTSTVQLGKQYGCSNASIFLFLRNSNVLIRQTKVKACNTPKIKELYDQGMSAYAIAKELGISGQTVGRALIGLGYEISVGKKQREDPLVNHKQEIIRLYQSGEGSYLIGKRFNCKDSSIVTSLQRWGVKLRPLRQYPVNESFFEKIETEAQAYVLGFLYADGCNQTNGSVTLSITDLEILEKIKKVMEFEGPLIETLPSEGRKSKLPIYKMCIGCRKMSDDLIRLGCVHRKTYCAHFPTEDMVPQHLVRHFLRGLNDGDGTITHSYSVYNKIRWHTRIVGTKELMEGIRDFIKKELSINCGCCVVNYTEKTNHETWSFYVSGHTAIKTYLDWLYQDAVIYMERKYEKYQECLNS